MKNEGKYGLHVIESNGLYFFVGSVPKELAIRKADGSILSDKEFEDYRLCSTPSMVARIHGYKSLSFNTEAEAWSEAEKYVQKEKS
jgi:hypothetical protein